MNYFNGLDGIQDAIVGFVVHQIYLAPIILLVLEEIGVPLPFADIVIAYTGYQVAVGRIPYVVAYIILLISDLIGVTILYLLSRRYGKVIVQKFGKYIDLDMNKLDFFESKFRKYGPIAIIIGRHIYGFKVPITLFSGISKMRYWLFLLSVFISDSFWIPFYLSLGKRLGPKTIKLFHTYHVNHWYYFLILIPIVLALLPFFLMRKNNAQKKA
ncbi:MAG TPA: DedA family protein [Candidatus Saccharimonadales bacterium]|nr:DedA family protein [Candidatus Saccharimonadales bacterium]